MSIKSQLRIINLVQQMTQSLQSRYTSNPAATLELNKLQESLSALSAYLDKVDAGASEYDQKNTDEYINGLNLHIDILKEELNPIDFVKLQKGVRAIKTVMRFHPKKYNYLTFIIAWFTEMIYFI